MTGNSWEGQLVSSLARPFTELSSAAEEKALLEAFAVHHRDAHDLAAPAARRDALLAPIFDGLVLRRLLSRDWAAAMSGEHRYVALICVRVLLRDPHFQGLLLAYGGLDALGAYAVELTEAHLGMHEGAFALEALVEVTATVRRFARQRDVLPALRASRLLEAMLRLLGTMDSVLLQQVLSCLDSFATHDDCLADIFTPATLDALIMVLAQYNAEHKRLVLLLLVSGARDMAVRNSLLTAGVLAPVLTLLGQVPLELLSPLLNLLRKLVDSKEATQEIASLGGIPLLVCLLATVPPAAPAPLLRAHVAPLQLLCSVLTALAKDPEAAYQVRSANGVYLLGRLLLRRYSGAGADTEAVFRCYLLRALRFLFSVERNRAIFKRLFPPELYVRFIDLGHFEGDLARYGSVWQHFGVLPEAQVAAFAAALEDANQGKGAVLRRVRNYALLELLGKGAFGRVWKAKGNERLVALKELPIKEVRLFGATDEERKHGVGRVASEVSILSSLDHPHVVKYFESFELDEHLYIVMELVEGETLADHLHTLAEKQRPCAATTMPEEEVVTQLLQALHYIHATKGIVHRDLTPSNVVLGRALNGAPIVKLADFGLAKLQTEDSIMQSMVGTMTYTCPEIVRNQPYNEKADMWSLGCIVYHMMTGRAPFNGKNPFTLASQIVEGRYAPIVDPPPPAVPYSHALKSTLKCLLTIDPKLRPSAAGVAAMLGPVLLQQLDTAAAFNQRLARSLGLREQREQVAAQQRMKREAAFRRLHRTASRPDVAEDSDADAAAVASPRSVERDSCSPGVRSPDVSMGRTVKVASSRLRLVTDPCTRLLWQLHKLEWLAQLGPSTASDSAMRRQVERFRRTLFGAHTNAGSVKIMLVKLMHASPDVIDSCETGDQGGSEPRLTYQVLHRNIEELLARHGYSSETFLE